MFKEINAWESEAETEIKQGRGEWFMLNERFYPKHGDVIVLRWGDYGIYPHVVLVNDGYDRGNLRYQRYEDSSTKILVSGSTKPVYWKLIDRDGTPAPMSPAELAEWRAYFTVHHQKGNGKGPKDVHCIEGG